MKSETLNGILLILILGYCGYRLGTNAWIVHQFPARNRSIVGSSQNLVFQSEGGIDIAGNLISPLAPANSVNAAATPSKPFVRTLAFLLHGSSAATDLDFWHKVEESLPKSKKLRLVGYCDGDPCVVAVKHSAHTSDFPVIAYAELTNAEALINADKEGNSLLKKDPKSGFANIEWRKVGDTPASVLQEALK